MTAGLAALLLASACAAPYNPAPTIPVGTDAYTVMNDASAKLMAEPYRISHEDTLNVNVFMEPDLSATAVNVDQSGQIALPGIGAMRAEGLTAVELSAKIAASLRGRLLRDPKVAVSVASSAKQRVVVAGQVNNPGVYDIRRDTTLIEAVTRAGGESEIAKLSDVAVFRTINGQRMAARFDVGAMMSGARPDIPVLGNDIIVVGYSRSRAFWRDLKQTVPVIGLFRPVYR